MSEYGYFSIPRSLTRDFEEFEISLKYQKIFLIILDYMAFEEKEMNNSGLKVLVKPFQLLASENTLLEWCNKGLRSEDKISESMIHRALTKFESLGWISKENFKKRRQNGECQKSNQLPNQLSNQQKCLLIVLRNDIINIHKQPIEPATEPAANQLRTSSEPQRKKEKKEEERFNNSKSTTTGKSGGGNGIFFDRERDSFSGIKEKDLEDWAKAFPNIKIEQELKEMKVWLIQNVDYKGNSKFILKWLNRNNKEEKNGNNSRSNVYKHDPVQSSKASFGPTGSVRYPKGTRSMGRREMQDSGV